MPSSFNTVEEACLPLVRRDSY